MHSSTAEALRLAQPMVWANPDLAPDPPAEVDVPGHRLTAADLADAQSRFRRFAPLLMTLFPELAETQGQVESPLLAAPRLQDALGLPASAGALWVKGDHQLPVAGSIKARGGLHEVLQFAEAVALREGLLPSSHGARSLASASARKVFARYRVAVGSTGNLGLSVGVIAAALGFHATVHMSADAKAWKKQRLRARGVEVVEHEGDYASAVAAGRAQALGDPFTHFVDDEHSLSLLLGYGAAASHLQAQLQAARRTVDARHPLLVYLPCGVGGAPAGILLGLKQLYGPHVHCFFVEPVQSPCFAVQMLVPDTEHPSVYDFGLTNQTEADGLAVPRGSLLARAIARPLLAGVITVEDATLFRHLQLAARTEALRLEPSAAAGFSGPQMLLDTAAGQALLATQGLQPHMARATHLAWTTGGLFVPEVQYQEFLGRPTG